MNAVRILLVDDHPLFRAATACLLRPDLGFEVVGEAADGAEAVEQARLHRPDVILMDLAMPVMGGLAATRQILAENGEARVIVLTASESRDCRFSAFASGALACLPKNASMADFYATIRRVAGMPPADDAAGSTHPPKGLSDPSP
jgi:DNA-binding NarL/FixJ family response regulator